MSNHIIHLANGHLQPDTPFSHVREILNQAAVGKNIVLHFHGGLVSETRGRQIADDLTPVYTAAGAYPVFFVWEAGFLETIKNNLGQIAGEFIFRTILKRVTRILRRKHSQSDGERAANTLAVIDTTDLETAIEQALDAIAAGEDVEGVEGELLAQFDPTTDMDQLSLAEEIALEMELQGDAALIDVVGQVSNGLRNRSDITNEFASRSANTVQGSTETLMDPESLARMFESQDPGTRGILSLHRVAKAIVAVAKRVINRMRNGRSHGLHATIIEEILREFYLANVGGLIWKHMKQDTEDSFGNDPQIFGGTAVLQILNELVEADNDIRITLVGHSTGAVYISHLLEKAAEIRPAGFNFDIVFLAPASTFQSTAAAFANYPEQIAGIRIFTMTETNEKSDILVPYLYPHSLLYFISGVVEFEPDAPIVGMQRFHSTTDFPTGAFPDVGALRSYLAGVDNSIVWSVTNTAAPGLNSESLKHGNFDNDPVTLSSLQHILQSGL